MTEPWDAFSAMSKLETVVKVQAAAIRHIIGRDPELERDHHVLCALEIIESAVAVAWDRIDGEKLQPADAL